MIPQISLFQDSLAKFSASCKYNCNTLVVKFQSKLVFGIGANNWKHTTLF